MTAERKRLEEDELRKNNWKRWGPYLSERQWGTVREDYSQDGNCWNHLTHDDSRSRAYRWGEDGLLGISDRECRLNLSLALWNTKDPILKERLFGLTGHQGNHGEDVKELYYYLDSTPTHSYMSALYKYPQGEFPYSDLVHENGRRNVQDAEYELLDTGLLNDGRYFDVKAEYSKSSANNVLGRYTITNNGPAAATIHVLPTVWFRNVWSWGKDCYCYVDPKPFMKQSDDGRVFCSHQTLGVSQNKIKTLRRTVSSATFAEDHTAPGQFVFEADVGPNGECPTLLFTENDTNYERLYGVPNQSKYVKDAFHEYVIKGDVEAINPDCEGTKCAAHYILTIQPGQEVILKVRLYYERESQKSSFTPEFDSVFEKRIIEADAYYKEVIPNNCKLEYQIARQAYAGLLWSKQFYYYIIKEWLAGDSTQPPPPEGRLCGRNADWSHLFNRDIISMPDKWEYPWYASWDLAFHMITMANVDSLFAKDQLILLLREWYMHPNGQIPAYEFAFEDVNPPVHAYAVLKVYKASGQNGGKEDIQFLARCFHKLVLNFTWWINRKDTEGKNIFSGGFLGLDNIGVFDRSKPLPTGGSLIQADATAWMAFFCSIMLEISLILAHHDHIYEDMASKFFEHFVAIVDAINSRDGIGLWNDEDGFYYDHIKGDNETYPMKILSMVGVVPLFSCLVLKESDLKKHPDFHKRTKWFLQHRKDLAKSISFMCHDDNEEALILSMVKKEQLVRVLGHLLNEDEFLSPYGIRSLSKHHKEQPFEIHTNNGSFSVQYEPGESESKMFGGNSNWRGPIWFPLNYVLIENLHRYDYFYGNSLQVECPTGSGNMMRLKDVAINLAKRMANLFLPNSKGVRPCHGEDARYAQDPKYKDLILFYEYFHGDTGRGCGASHQTGWTALVANILQKIHKSDPERDTCLGDFTQDEENVF